MQQRNLHATNTTYLNQPHVQTFWQTKLSSLSRLILLPNRILQPKVASDPCDVLVLTLRPKIMGFLVSKSGLIAEQRKGLTKDNGMLHYSRRPLCLSWSLRSRRLAHEPMIASPITPTQNTVSMMLGCVARRKNTTPKIAHIPKKPENSWNHSCRNFSAANRYVMMPDTRAQPPTK